MKNEMFLENFLTEEFDLSQKEVALYINLLKYGQLTIFELAKAANMNRSTTHVNVDTLVQKGLATQTSKGRGSRRYILAEPVEKLELLLKNKKAKLEAAENQLPDVILGLKSLNGENIAGESMEIRRYKGKEEVKLLYDEILKADEMRAYVNFKALTTVFPINMQKFIDAHNKRPNMQIWEIMENSDEAKLYAEQMPSERYFCRLTTKQLALASIDYLLFDGKVAIIDATKEVSGILINNEAFYENSKSIYEFVWGFLPAHHK